MYRNRNSNRAPILFLGMLMASLIGTTAVFADDFLPQEQEIAKFKEYERKLNAMLKTRRDEEKLFVGQVVAQVQAGKIPSKIVATSYDWVRKKRPLTNYPFIYFEKVLRIQATALGLEDEIPPFDYGIYKSAGQTDPDQRGSAGQRTLTRLKAFFTPGSRR